MQYNTKAFGKVEIPDKKVLVFPHGIVGYPEMTMFSILHDAKYGEQIGICWLQSLTDPNFAMPVINPAIVVPEYNPKFSDSDTAVLGKFDGQDGILLVTMSIVDGIESATVNLSGPILINPTNNLGCQIILPSDNYPVKYAVYEALKALQGGESV